jgi:hypothetical protein
LGADEFNIFAVSRLADFYIGSALHASGLFL